MGEYIYVVKYCEKCGEITSKHPVNSTSVCKNCNIELKLFPEELQYKYHIMVEDWDDLAISHNEEIFVRLENFVMGELKDNPIFSMDEYNKQIQKRKDLYQKYREADKKRANYTPNIPKCPICNSTDINKISFGSRVIKTAFFGIVGAVDDSGKTYKCKNCGSKF